MRSVLAPEGGLNASVVPLLHTVAVESKVENRTGKKKACRKKRISFTDTSIGDMTASKGDVVEVTPQVTARLKGSIGSRIEGRVVQGERLARSS